MTKGLRSESFPGYEGLSSGKGVGLGGSGGGESKGGRAYIWIGHDHHVTK